MHIIVVGAGIVGCAIAHELAARGAQVRLLDHRGTGLGATRASAGILASTIEGHVPALLELGGRSLALYEDFIRRVSSDAGQPVEYERSGTLQVALDASEADDLCALARTFDAVGITHSLLDGGEARRLEPALSDGVTRALLVPQHGYVAVGQLTRALARAAANRGAAVSTSHVLKVEGGATPAVTTDDGTIAADALVLATGSWTDRLVSTERQAPSAVKPIRGQLLQLRLDRRAAARPIWGARCYAVPWRDGAVLVGATVEDVGFDERPTAVGVQSLLSEAFALLPVLQSAAFEEVRVGLRPMTRDELPAVGPSSTMPNVFYAVGHYRNGVLLAPLTASLIGDLVLDRREPPELAMLRPERLGLP